MLWLRGALDDSTLRKDRLTSGPEKRNNGRTVEALNTYHFIPRLLEKPLRVLSFLLSASLRNRFLLTLCLSPSLSLYLFLSLSLSFCLFSRRKFLFFHLSLYIPFRTVFFKPSLTLIFLRVHIKPLSLVSSSLFFFSFLPYTFFLILFSPLTFFFSPTFTFLLSLFFFFLLFSFALFPSLFITLLISVSHFSRVTSSQMPDISGDVTTSCFTASLPEIKCSWL